MANLDAYGEIISIGIYKMIHTCIMQQHAVQNENWLTLYY